MLIFILANIGVVLIFLFIIVLVVCILQMIGVKIANKLKKIFGKHK